MELSGSAVVENDCGILIITASSGLNEEARMKNVTNRNARSTMGVMSIDGLLLGSFIFGIT
jgi:hypothetical protein